MSPDSVKLSVLHQHLSSTLHRSKGCRPAADAKDRRRISAELKGDVINCKSVF